MIEILRKEECVGCNACAQRCPKSCISMNEDEQGFLYPVVDLDKCIDCHLCEKVCPVINQGEPRKSITTYAAKNNDLEIQKSSSSGGIFFALAQNVIKEGGVVFGVKFNNNWEVIHAYAETLDDVRAFQGSKYVQSRIGETYAQAEEFLKSGRKVLFSGTPCQIAGLKRYLRNDYGKLLFTVDLICHGVPSPLVWHEYLRFISIPKGEFVGKKADLKSTLKDGKISDISHISFRDKRVSWEKFGFSVHAVAQKDGQNSDFQSCKTTPEEYELLFETLDKNLFMQGFLKDLYLRPSCYKCPAKCGKSGADITLADFWGVQRYYPELYSKGYYSLVLKSDEADEELLETQEMNLLEVNSMLAIKSNPAFIKSAVKPCEYFKFWHLWPKEGVLCISEVIKSMRPSIMHRIKAHIIRNLENILGREKLNKYVDKIKGRRLYE